MNLAGELARLEGAQLVRAVADADLAYLFRHTLVQETAYTSLLAKSRRAIHAELARCYEQVYTDSLEEHAALLTHHFAASGDDPAATLKYATLAGDVAFRRSANAEAISHYTLALENALRVHAAPSPSRPESDLPGGSTGVGSAQLIYLYSRRGRALELSGQWQAALANYAELGDVGRRRGDRALELAALMAEATTRSTPTPLFDAALAEQLSERALTLARELGDPASEAKILWNRSLLAYFSVQPAQSIAFGEQAIAIARRMGVQEQLAYALHDIHRSYVALGQAELGGAALAEAEALWRELDNQPLLADSLSSAAEIALTGGDYDRALDLTGESLRISEKIGNTWGMSYSLITSCYVHVDRGDAGRAIPAIERSLELAQQSGFTVPLAVGRLGLALVYRMLGDRQAALQQLDLADAPVQTQFPAAAAALAAVRVGIQLDAGDVAGAEQTFRQTVQDAGPDEAQFAVLTFSYPLLGIARVELALAESQYAVALKEADRLLAQMRRFGIRASIADVLYLKGLALLWLGLHQEGRAALDAARSEAGMMRSNRIAWRIRVALADLSAGQGDFGAAEDLRREARAIVAIIAEQTGSADRRASFLARPDVRRVMYEGAV